MFALFSRYYRDVAFETFSSDLSEKDVVWVFAQRGAVVGFTTLLVRESEREALLYSGDTVLERELWGSKLLQRAFLREIVRVKLRRPWRPAYWLLMSKGERTYLMMRRNFPVSYPRAGATAPSRLARVMDAFYAQKFGAAYDPERGLVRFGERRGAVREEHLAAQAAQREGGDAEAAFFLKRNPEHADGVELACIAELRLRDVPWQMKKFRRPAPSREIVLEV